MANFQFGVNWPSDLVQISSAVMSGQRIPRAFGVMPPPTVRRVISTAQRAVRLRALRAP